MGKLTIASKEYFGLCIWGTRRGLMDFYIQNLHLSGDFDHSPWTALAGKDDPRGLFTTAEGMPFIYHIIYRDSIVCLTIFQHIYDNESKSGRNGFLAISLFYDGAYVLDFGKILESVRLAARKLKEEYIIDGVLDGDFMDKVGKEKWNLPALSNMDIANLKFNEPRQEQSKWIVYNPRDTVDLNNDLINFFKWTYVYGQDRGYYLLTRLQAEQSPEQRMLLNSVIGDYRKSIVTRRIQVITNTKDAEIILKNNRGILDRSINKLKFKGPVQDSDFPLTAIIRKGNYETKKEKIELKDLVDGRYYHNPHTIELKENEHSVLSLISQRTGKVLSRSDFEIVDAQDFPFSGNTTKVYEVDYMVWVGRKIKPAKYTYLESHEFALDDFVKHGGKIELKSKNIIELYVYNGDKNLLVLGQDFTMNIGNPPEYDNDIIDHADKKRLSINLEKYLQDKDIRIDVRSEQYGEYRIKMHEVKKLLTYRVLRIVLPKKKTKSYLNLSIFKGDTNVVLPGVNVQIIGPGIEESFKTNYQGVINETLYHSEKNEEIDFSQCSLTIEKKGYEPEYNVPFSTIIRLRQSLIDHRVPINNTLEDKKLRFTCLIGQHDFSCELVNRDMMQEGVKQHFDLEIKIPRIDAEELIREKILLSLTSAYNDYRLHYNKNASLQELIEKGVKVKKKLKIGRVFWIKSIGGVAAIAFIICLVTLLNRTSEVDPLSINTPPICTGEIRDKYNMSGDSVRIAIYKFFKDNNSEDSLTYSAKGLPKHLELTTDGVIKGTFDKEKKRVKNEVIVTATDKKGSTAQAKFVWFVQAKDTSPNVKKQVESKTDENRRIDHQAKIDLLQKRIEEEIKKSDFKSDLANTIIKWEDELKQLGAWAEVSMEIKVEEIELYKKVATAIYLMNKWNKWSDKQFLKNPKKEKLYNNIYTQLNVLCKAQNIIGDYPSLKQRNTIKIKYSQMAIRFAGELGGANPCGNINSGS